MLFSRNHDGLRCRRLRQSVPFAFSCTLGAAIRCTCLLLNVVLLAEGARPRDAGAGRSK